MKKTGIFFVLTFISFFSIAQVQRVVEPKKGDSTVKSNPTESRPGKADRRKMMEELNLSKEQRSKIKEIRQSEISKREAITNDDKLTAEQKDAKLRDLKKEQVQNMQSVLNDEQKAKMRGMKNVIQRRRQQNQ